MNEEGKLLDYLVPMNKLLELGYTVVIAPVDGEYNVRLYNAQSILVSECQDELIYDAITGAVNSIIETGFGDDDDVPIWSYTPIWFATSDELPDDCSEIIAHWDEEGTFIAFYEDEKWYHAGVKNYWTEMKTPVRWCYLPIVNLS